MGIGSSSFPGGKFDSRGFFLRLLLSTAAADMGSSSSSLPQAVYESHERSGMTHRIFVFYHATKPGLVRGILDNPSSMRRPSGPAGPGVYLSRDPEEARQFGDVVLKVLAYTGRVKRMQIQQKQQHRGNDEQVDSYYYFRNGPSGNSVAVTCLKSEKNVKVLGVCKGWSKLDRSVQCRLAEAKEGRLSQREEGRLDEMVRALGLRARGSGSGMDTAGGGRGGGYGMGGEGGGWGEWFTGGGGGGGSVTPKKPKLDPVWLGDPLSSLNSNLKLRPPPRRDQHPSQGMMTVATPRSRKAIFHLDMRDRRSFSSSADRAMAPGGGLDASSADPYYLGEAFDQMGGRAVMERIRNLTAEAPERVPKLRQLRPGHVSLTQSEVCGLLSLGALCALPRPPQAGEFKGANFDELYASDMPEKIKCLRAYFGRRAATSGGDGVVTYKRTVLDPRSTPSWKDSRVVLDRRFHVSSHGSIEDQSGMLQVDFANEHVGGGVLERGSVQEELFFLKCPELIAAKVFTERLTDEECLVVTGFQRYSDLSGYSYDFRWAGEHSDSSRFDRSSQQRMSKMVAMDAKPFNVDPKEQYSRANVLRELNKAFLGFNSSDEDGPHPAAVATGNWGCGAFGGDPHLKSLLQLMAAAANGREVAYFAGGDVELAQDVAEVYQLIRTNQVTVGELYRMIVDFSPSHGGGGGGGGKSAFRDYIRRRLEGIAQVHEATVPEKRSAATGDDHRYETEYRGQFGAAKRGGAREEEEEAMEAEAEADSDPVLEEERRIRAERDRHRYSARGEL